MANETWQVCHTKVAILKVELDGACIVSHMFSSAGLCPDKATCCGTSITSAWELATHITAGYISCSCNPYAQRLCTTSDICHHSWCRVQVGHRTLHWHEV